MEKVSGIQNFERAKTEEVKMAEENVLSLTVDQDINPTSAPSTLVSGIVAERQKNLAHYGSVQSVYSEKEIVTSDGGWGWFIVLASFFMQFIGGY